MEPLRVEPALPENGIADTYFPLPPRTSILPASTIGSRNEDAQGQRPFRRLTLNTDTAFAASSGLASRPRPSPIKTTSFNTVTRRNKAQSMSFPVLLSTSPNLKAVSASSQPAAKPSPSPRPEDVSPTDDGFLTALAAQERQVLELKEELQKAEDGLAKLKKQWVTHEATKRQYDSAKLHQLQRLSVASPRNQNPSSTPSPTWAYEEVERKKALASGPKSKHRRAFSGSRHTRTLSLISSDVLRRQNTSQSPALHGLGIHEESPDSDAQAFTEEPKTIPEISTKSPSDTPTLPASVFMGPSNHDRLARQSMQMAAEFRDGLWTFFEDLKHATYGEEPRSLPPRPQTASSSRSRRQTKSTIHRQTWEIRLLDEPELLDAEGPFSPDADINTPPVPQLTDVDKSLPQAKSLTPATSKSSLKSQNDEKSVKTPQSKPKPSHILIRDFDNETWESWSTPGGISPSRSNRSNSSGSGNSNDSSNSNNSQSQSISPPSTQTSASNSLGPTPRQSTTVSTPSKRDLSEQPTTVPTPSKKDSLAWPALNKLKKPNLNFRRTASHLMDEWQRSLSPGSEASNQRFMKHDEAPVQTVSALH